MLPLLKKINLNFLLIPPINFSFHFHHHTIHLELIITPTLFHSIHIIQGVYFLIYFYQALTLLLL